MVSQTIDNMKVDTVASQKSAEWVDTKCVTRTVTSTQAPNENVDDFCKRHDKSVAADMERYGVKKEK